MDTREQDLGGVLGGVFDAENAPVRKRRIRSPHPGVKLIARARLSGLAWIARYVDPDLERVVEESLGKLGLHNERARTNWAKRKAQQLAQRRNELQNGSARLDRTSVDDAVAFYFKIIEAKVRPNTIRNYWECIGPFVHWCRAAGIDTLADFSKKRLAGFVDWLYTRPARESVKGKGVRRGAKVAKYRKLSAHTHNRTIRSVRTMLTFWRKREMVPQLNTDYIRDALEFVKTERRIPKFLNRGQVEQLLNACIRHDFVNFKATRTEHKQNIAQGSTPRYEAVTPFLLTVLLSGMRFGEAAELKWSAIDQGSEQIHLTASDTKTKQDRLVDLRVTPQLTKLLAALRLRAGEGIFLFGGTHPISRGTWESTRKRLITDFGAPDFTWHDLRRTCATFLVCAPRIYGSASTIFEAKRLGHSIEVAERHYLGLVRDIPTDAATLEDALGIKVLVEQYLTQESNASVQDHSVLQTEHRSLIA